MHRNRTLCRRSKISQDKEIEKAMFALVDLCFLSAARSRGDHAVLSARRAAPELAMTTTIRNTPRTTDCQ